MPALYVLTVCACSRCVLYYQAQWQCGCVGHDGQVGLLEDYYKDLTVMYSIQLCINYF